LHLLETVDRILMVEKKKKRKETGRNESVVLVGLYMTKIEHHNNNSNVRDVCVSGWREVR